MLGVSLRQHWNVEGFGFRRRQPGSARTWLTPAGAWQGRSSSPRCYRWWASEVDAFAASLRRKRPDRSVGGDGSQRTTKPQAPRPAMPPRRITGKVRAARAHREAP